MILNLTQHKATPEQLAAGVVDVPADELPRLQGLLTFDTLPSAVEIEKRANDIALFAHSIIRRKSPQRVNAVMIGGAPFLMAPLERALSYARLNILYAFSRRESIEKLLPDGGVRKEQVFRHAGFVWADQGFSQLRGRHNDQANDQPSEASGRKAQRGRRPKA